MIWRIIRIVWYLLLLDACHVWMDLNPMFHLTHEAAREAHARRPGLLAFNCFCFMVAFYGTVAVLYDALALASVALGLSESRVWPAAFGRWRDAYTVRRFWG